MRLLKDDDYHDSLINEDTGRCIGKTITKSQHYWYRDFNYNIYRKDTYDNYNLYWL